MMKSGSWPSGIVVEREKASNETGIDLVIELANMNEGVVPADWKVSSIANSYKGKGDALKLLEHAMKVVVRIVEASQREGEHWR